MRGPISPVPALTLALLAVFGLEVGPPQQVASVASTVVLSRPDDPYRPLAEEIASTESIPLLDSPEAAFSRRPTFLLWVVSPARLSDRVMTPFTATLDHQRPRISFGLITGSTLEKARALYGRRTSVSGAHTAAILGDVTFNAARVVETDADDVRTRPLGGVRDILGLLTRAGYVHYSGHGGGTSWHPLSDQTLKSAAIANLPPVVVSTTACQTARIWTPDSIALRFVDEGAAAYSGFYYSPLAGFHIGENDGFFRYTWPEVPIGHVVQLVSEGTLRGYAGLAFHVLLGDPRIALRAQPPCGFTDTGDSGGTRTVSCREAPPGLIPIRVARGARYTFVEVGSRTAGWDGDPFYNRRIQMTTIGDDRFLLVEHGGGDLTLVLRSEPPVGWQTRDLLTDSLDDMLVSMADRRHGGDLIGLVLAGLATAVAGYRMRRRHAAGQLLLAATIGLVAGSLHACYGFLRQGEVLTTSKSIVFSPFAAVATGVLVACGASFYFTAKSWRGRLAGVMTATLVGWVGAAIGFGMRAGASVIIAYAADIDAWIYRPEWHQIVISALGCVVWAVAFSAASAAVTRQGSPAAVSRAGGGGTGAAPAPGR